MARGPGGSSTGVCRHTQPPCTRSRVCGQQTPGPRAQEGRGGSQGVGGTHVAHPVHGGADQVEGADTDGPHAVCLRGLAVGAQLLRLPEGRAECVLSALQVTPSWAPALRRRPERSRTDPAQPSLRGRPCHPSQAGSSLCTKIAQGSRLSRLGSATRTEGTVTLS